MRQPPIYINVFRLSLDEHSLGRGFATGACYNKVSADGKSVGLHLHIHLVGTCRQVVAELMYQAALHIYEIYL